MPTFYNTGVTPKGSAEETSNKAMTDKLGDLTANPAYRNIQGNPYYDFIGGKISFEDAQARITGSTPYDPNKGDQIDYGSGPKPLTQEQSSGLASGKSIQDVAQYVPQNVDINKGIAQSNQNTQLAQMPPEMLANAKRLLEDTANAGGNALGDGSAAPVRNSSTSATSESSNPSLADFDFQSAFVNKYGTRPNAPAAVDTSGVTSASDDLVTAQKAYTDLQTKIANDTSTLQGTAGLTSSYINKELKSMNIANTQALATAKQAVQNATQVVSARTAAVNAAMKATNQSYTEATKAWDKNYSDALAQYKLNSSTATKEQAQYGAQIKAFVSQFKNATNYTLTPDMKATVESWDVAAGHPAGYTESLLALQKAGNSVDFSEVRGGTTYTHAHDAQGNPIILKTLPTTTNPNISTKKAPKQTVDQAIQEVQANIEARIKNVPRAETDRNGNPVKYLSPPELKAYRDAWIQDGFKAADFDVAFSDYIKPTQ